MNAEMSRRALLFGGVLGAAGLAAPIGGSVLEFGATNTPPLPSLIPERIGAWRHVGAQGLVVPSEKPISRFYDQELHRIYFAPGAPPMMLVIAYCARPQQGLLQIHDPRVCYPGSGFSLSDGEQVPLKLGGGPELAAQSFTASRPGRTEQVLYWTRVGDSISKPGDSQHLAILRTLARGSVPDGLLVRLSSLGSGAPVMNEIVRFADALVAALPAAGRALLLGPELAASWRGTA